MPATKLSPEEKKRLERFMEDVKRDPLDFITRQKVRIIMTTLGAYRFDKILLSDGLSILKDDGLFKLYRLRKLINGRRPRQ